MCDYCSHILGSLTHPHTRLTCKLRQSMYCPVCASTGHTPADCPNKIAWALRKGLPKPKEGNLTFRVEDSAEGVKSVLKENGIEPTSTQMKNNSLLRNLVNSMQPPRMLLFYPASGK